MVRHRLHVRTRHISSRRGRAHSRHHLRNHLHHRRPSTLASPATGQSDALDQGTHMEGTRRRNRALLPRWDPPRTSLGASGEAGQEAPLVVIAAEAGPG